MKSTILSGETFSIISFIDNPSGSKTPLTIQAHSVKRFPDGEIFTLGDLVTNGTKMKGNITGFNILEGKMFVDHTWSGVGMNLDSLSKVIHLPSKHQHGDSVLVKFSYEQDGEVRPMKAKVLAVHFYNSKVKYDLEIPIYDEESTRIYNIDEVFVSPAVAT